MSGRKSSSEQERLVRLRSGEAALAISKGNPFQVSQPLRLEVLARNRARTFDAAAAHSGRGAGRRPWPFAYAYEPLASVRKGSRLQVPPRPEADARHCSMVSKLHDCMREI